MPTPTLTIQAAAAKLAAIETDIARVEAAIAELPATSATQLAQDEHAHRLHEVEDLTVSHKLGQVTEAAVADGLAALEKASQKLEQTTREQVQAMALRAGLQRRGAQLQADVKAAQAALEEAQGVWLYAELVKADQAYATAAGAAWAAWNRIDAIRAALRGLGQNVPAGSIQPPELPASGPVSCKLAMNFHSHIHGVGQPCVPRRDGIRDQRELRAELDALEKKPRGLISTLKAIVT